MSNNNVVFRDDYTIYTQKPEQNLIPGIFARDYEADLLAAPGNELTDDESGPAKFCAAYSSSALVVNSFGPFRHMTEKLQILGYSQFVDTQFEKPLPTGLKGKHLYPDFYASATEHVICIESKFLEPLKEKMADFAISYERKVAELADPAWMEVYRLPKEQSFYFRRLDVAQLVKHYLGMLHTLGEAGKLLVLIYLYWEPENAIELEAFQKHREEVEHFSNLVKGGFVAFHSRSYEALWNDWAIQSDWSGIELHLDNLRQRYSFAI